MIRRPPRSTHCISSAASDVYKRQGRKVSLTLSDGFCVDRHRPDFVDLVADGVDILFANEDEIMKLYGVDSFDAGVAAVRGVCDIAAVTRGRHGSVIVTAQDVVPVQAHQVAKRVDTTGAGDLYASGFLYGWATGRPLHECGRLGSIAAAAVIGHMGPCLLYTSPSPRDLSTSRMPSSA